MILYLPTLLPSVFVQMTSNFKLVLFSIKRLNLKKPSKTKKNNQYHLIDPSIPKRPQVITCTLSFINVSEGLS